MTLTNQLTQPIGHGREPMADLMDLILFVSEDFKGTFKRGLVQVLRWMEELKNGTVLPKTGPPYT